MLDPIELSNKITEYNQKALDIIAKNGLDFNAFYYSTTYYDYNISIKGRRYKKVLASDYLILKAIIKCDYKLLEVL